MLPRTEVDFIDAEMPAYKAVKFAAERPHSRYPVTNGSADDIVGFVHVRDLFDPAVASRSVRVGDLARDVLMLPDTAKLLPTLTEMRRDAAPIWRSCWTSTAVRRASSRWRTWSRS